MTSGGRRGGQETLKTRGAALARHARVPRIPGQLLEHDKDAHDEPRPPRARNFSSPGAALARHARARGTAAAA